MARDRKSACLVGMTAAALCTSLTVAKAGATEVVVSGFPDLSWVNRVMDLMTESFSVKSDRSPNPGLRYVSRPVIGNHEHASLAVPLPDGDVPHRVLLDQPIALSIVVSADSTPSLELEGESNVISRVVPVFTENGELKLTFDTAVEASEPVTASLTLPSLEAVYHESRSRVDISGLSGERLRLVESGGGMISASGQVNTLNASVLNGSANLESVEVKEDLFMRAGRHTDVRVNAQGSVLQPTIHRLASACYVGEPREFLAGEGAALKPCPSEEDEADQEVQEEGSAVSS